MLQNFAMLTLTTAEEAEDDKISTESIDLAAVNSIISIKKYHYFKMVFRLFNQ